MIKYRITKYNPIYRNEKGVYLKKEWTSICDIGKNFDDGILTKESYLLTEIEYLNCVKYFLKQCNIRYLIISNLEKCNFNHYETVDDLITVDCWKLLKNHSKIEFNEIFPLVGTILREQVWCILLSEDKNFKIEIGYDYYLYITCNLQKVEYKSENVQLYIEKYLDR